MGGVEFQITYAGGDGNDVVLTVVSAAAPGFSLIALTGTNTLVLGGQGTPNTTYVIEAAPHLNAPIPWAPVATNMTDGTGAFQFIDAEWASFPGRFFRFVQMQEQ